MDALLLLLLDSRSPAGGHNHSGGMEAAVMHGLVRDVGDVEQFCRTRLQTGAFVAAGFAAAACAAWSTSAADGPWLTLDREYGARTPSEAQRAASRALGRGLLRLLRAVVPAGDFAALSPAAGVAPHHPLVLGAGIAACGGGPHLAARAAALSACTSAASAGVRLLGLDPFAVQAALARLAGDIDLVAARAADTAAVNPPAGLPADSAPALDLLADVHLTAEVRLFAS
jgi:urease accessory protein